LDEFTHAAEQSFLFVRLFTHDDDRFAATKWKVRQGAFVGYAARQAQCILKGRGPRTCGIHQEREPGGYCE